MLMMPLETLGRLAGDAGWEAVLGLGIAAFILIVPACIWGEIDMRRQHRKRRSEQEAWKRRYRELTGYDMPDFDRYTR